ncbi:MinD/ParA family ATP-binding protein [Actinosynnema mirum]|uniref:ATPase involved in chromosome partitioning n=2 Tax=Actinosynnema TaxID=40566 RepID=C6WNE4_ACTMD|nr:MinD/ParA family protein [Actinosynnema mirum]ACU40508.1 ATPase involved in chromosome partitioning [Actinosynnema mirum DSM 43827]AXX34022.1 Proline and alanine rich protein EspI, component of Type VII secretion system ESX-1 [Actinosynnema pretiosum subsp. pretiosum]
MTGHYENPDSPRQQPGSEGNPNHSGSYPVDQGQGYADSMYADPSTAYIESTPSGGIPVPGSQSGAYPAPGSQSGAYQVSDWQSGAYPAPGSQSGAYPAPGSQSGAYPAPGSQSGAYPAPGSQSGAYPAPGSQSGAYQVPGSQSGGYPAPGSQSGGYPVGQPTGYPAPSNFPQGGYGGYGQQAPQQRGDGSKANEVSSQQLIKRAKRPPQSGWRKTLHSLSGGLINLGESPADLRRRELIGRINQPLRGCYKIAMLSLKGGVGKTTTTTTLGSTFSSLRGDRVIAVDANPDRGTLALKVPRETTATVRHLLRDVARITKYSDVRAYTSQSPSRLEVLASEQDPAASEAFSDQDYLRTVALLEHFYNIVLTDCGTGLMHSAMKGVLDQADSLVLVSSGSVDGAQTSAATLDWLEAHGYRDLVAKSVAVINSVRPGSGKVDLDKLAAHFAQRCRAVVRIPFDAHLEEGAEIELDKLSPDTRLALLELAAVVADDFPSK